MIENHYDLRCLIMSDFAEELFSEFGIKEKIEHGGWLKGRVAYQPEQMIEHINRSKSNLVIVEVDEISREVMRACPSLQLIASLRANPVNVDLTAANELGIVVLNTPGRNSQAVAELTLCLMLDLLRHVSAASVDLQQGRWGEKEEDPYLRFRGQELNGKTVGLLGLGDIGQAVARLLQSFEVKILACDPIQPVSTFRKVQASSVDLVTLFNTSDIISLHAPLNMQTKNLVNDNLLQKVKPGTILVNTARAHLIEKDALISALQEGRIEAAALDVHYEEPPSDGDVLLSLPNVLSTPHIGGATREVITKGSRMVLTDLVRLLNGDIPLHAAVYPKTDMRFSPSDQFRGIG
jgi:phosphoglycerate dehydrogenase-like enzyme